MTTPFLFDEFFHSGKQESISPFLTKRSRQWGKSLSLKSSFLSALFFIAALIAHFCAPSLCPLLLLFVYFLSGTPALLSTIEDLKNGELNIDVLMTLAALLSFLIGSPLEGGLLLVLFALSGAMEESVTKKASGTLHRLQALAPATAYVVSGEDRLVEKSLREIDVGTKILIKAGETVPLDGHVVAGTSFVNLIHLTGESLPLSKGPGDEVAAGSRNLDGTLTVRVTRTSQESTLATLAALITQAQEMKPKIQRFFDRFSSYYATTILSLSFAFALALPFFISIPFLGAEGSIYRALTFLIAASPCALIIATPTAYLSAINACARQGILLKGGTTLDALASCQAIAFDKTGTLTTGSLQCTGMEQLSPSSLSTCSQNEALALAAALERHSTHPMAAAICTYSAKQKVAPALIDHFHSTPGYGLAGTATLHNQKEVTLFIGSASFITEKLAHRNIDSAPLLKKRAAMTAFLLVDATLFAFSFTDFLRPDIDRTLSALRREGLDLIMLTGDHLPSAEKIAKKLKFSDFHADLRPADKLDLVARIAQEKGLAMVGDGMNDAPALARATVGISLGTIGSKTAIDAADIVLLRDHLHLLDWLYRKARSTLRVIYQNLSLALGVICLATTPALLGIIPLWAAVIVHEGGTVLVGLNALRLLKTQEKKK